MTDGVAVTLNYINDTIAHRAYTRKLEMEADNVGLEVRTVFSSRQMLVIPRLISSEFSTAVDGPSKRE